MACSGGLQIKRRAYAMAHHPLRFTPHSLRCPAPGAREVILITFTVNDLSCILGSMEEADRGAGHGPGEGCFAPPSIGVAEAQLSETVRGSGPMGSHLRKDLHKGPKERTCLCRS